MYHGLVRTHLKMPPCFLIAAEPSHNPLKLINIHLPEPIIVDNGPAPTLLAPDDVATRRLSVFVAVDAMAEVNLGVLTERGDDATCSI